ELPHGLLIRPSQLRKARRRLDEFQPDTRITIGTQVPQLEAMSALHSRRWNARGMPGNFGDRRRTDFVNRLQSDGSIDFLTMQLWAGDRLIAYRFGPLQGNVYYDWNTGFDPDWSRFSPGICLLDEALNAIHLEGLGRIDFMRGAEPYKLGWATAGDVV